MEIKGKAPFVGSKDSDLFINNHDICEKIALGVQKNVGSPCSPLLRDARLP